MQTTEAPFAKQFSVKRIFESREERLTDTVAAEEPLEIRIGYWFKDARMSATFAVTMRTPGHDRELTAGLLLGEGIISDRKQLTDLRSLGPEPSNEIVAELAQNVDFEDWRFARNSFVNSSCGICGKRTRETIFPQLQPSSSTRDDLRVKASLIENLPGLLAAHQDGFAKTGGLHAAALFSANGQMEAVYEDIGRHNALDKLIGSRVLTGHIPLRNRLLFLSSRSSFELIQKTIAAGVPVIATVGSPSSLAIEMAKDYGLTLIGFVRDRRFNIYSGEWRVDLE